MSNCSIHCARVLRESSIRSTPLHTNLSRDTQAKPSAPPIGQPLIIGHRGASAAAPENTIAAFARALSDGAEGIEFDVRLAQDGIPVVIHDSTLKRTALREGLVSEFSSTQVTRMDAGSWFNRKYPQFARADYSLESVPTLKRLFDVLADTAALLYLELKSDDAEGETLATAVIKLIKRYSLRQRVIVESFDLTSLETVKRLDASMRTAALFEPSRRPVSLLRKMKMVTLAKRCGAEEIALHHTLVSRRLVEQARQHNLQTVVWTVDNPAWMQRARSLGIKALITNQPAKMASLRNAPRVD